MIICLHKDFFEQEKWRRPFGQQQQQWNRSPDADPIVRCSRTLLLPVRIAGQR